MPTSIGRPRRPAIRREIPVHSYNWAQLVPFLRRLLRDDSYWHIWGGFNPGPEKLCNRVRRPASKCVFHNVHTNLILSCGKGHGFTDIEYVSVEVQVGSGLSGALNIHPVVDNTKCVGILGGIYGNGSPVDMYVAPRKISCETFLISFFLATIATNPTRRNGSGTGTP